MQCNSMISDFKYFGVGFVDPAFGVIRDIAVVTEGEAKGHGVFLDAEFVLAVVEAGNERKGGIKARFGHPSMSSTALGTFLGRFKNFRYDTGPNGEAMARADLFLSASAKDTPQGDLHSYVLGLAERDPEAFGASIVFEPDSYYIKSEDGEIITLEDPSYANGEGKVYVRMGKLRAADLVDDPAANPDGLFSAWSIETFAGQVSEFLDTHPHVFELLKKKPEVVEGFMTRYQSYVERKTMGNEKAEALGVDAEVIGTEDETAILATNEIDAELEESTETEESRAEVTEDAESEQQAEEAAEAEEDATDKVNEVTSEEAEPVQATVEALKTGEDFLNAFGDKGGVWFAKGMSFEEATQEHIKHLEAKVALLEEQIAQSHGEDPASFDSEPVVEGDFVQQAKSLAASEGITFSAAASRLARVKPELYADYRNGKI